MKNSPRRTKIWSIATPCPTFLIVPTTSQSFVTALSSHSVSHTDHYVPAVFFDALHDFFRLHHLVHFLLFSAVSPTFHFRTTFFRYPLSVVSDSLLSSVSVIPDSSISSVSDSWVSCSAVSVDSASSRSSGSGVSASSV